MTINLSVPSDSETHELKPRIAVLGVGGAGGNAVNNMIQSKLEGVEFVAANTDAQALGQSRTDRRIQLGATITRGLGAGCRPDIGRAAAEETMEEILETLDGVNMVFIAAGMGGGTGTGAAPVIARAAREKSILTVGVVTKPFHFEGVHRMRLAESGITELEQYVDTLIIIPNQNLFRVANEKTTFADAFSMADEVLYSGVRGVTDLIVMPGLINLDFADIRSVMSEMGKAMMGTGEAEGERRALDAAEAAISNPLLDDTSMKGAKGMLINITGGNDMTLFEVDEAANRIRSEVDNDAYIIFGSTFAEDMEGRMRVSVVATGIDSEASVQTAPTLINLVERTAAPAAPKEASDRPDAADQPAPAAADEPDADEPEAPPAAVARKEEPVKDIVPAALATRPGAAPRVGAIDAFIPPAPADQPGREAPKTAEPFVPARPDDVIRVTAKDQVRAPSRPRGPSLFERVTGTGRAARTAPPLSAPAVSPLAQPERGPQAAPAPSSPAPAAQKGAPSPLRSLDSAERVSPSRTDEDLLDIPAFLRRQAN